MQATIRFSGEVSFNKRVSLVALPDVGDAVRVAVPDSSEHIVNGVVTGRSFEPDCAEADCIAMTAVIDVQEA